jgi:UDPglucose 6-dehydrogenase
MNITIIGTGYVGLVSGACFADVGNSVLCLDLDEKKVAALRNGEIPIHEPGLEGIVHRNAAAGRLSFTTDYATAVHHAGVIFIAVGTPPDEDGSADLSHILAAAKSVGHLMRGPLVIVNKSTVPVGTADAVRNTIAQELAKRGEPIPFSVISNPEFLKEGAAVDDFMRPDRVIVGSNDANATKLMRQLYAPFNRSNDRLIEMDVRSAELTKYAANSMLAARISFMNELANLAEDLGADIESVRVGMGADPRIGPHFLYPGMGYGGSCFPKDVKALIKTGKDKGHTLQLLNAIESVNHAQKEVLFRKISSHFGGSTALAGKSIAIWGLAFKPNTDDMREAPSLQLIRRLIAAKCHIRAYDPVVNPGAMAILMAEHGRNTCEKFITIADSATDALKGADALAIATEWKEFRSPDFDLMARLLAHKVIFDGRNMYDPAVVVAAGLHYSGIGRIGQPTTALS